METTYYFVAKSPGGAFIGQLPLEEISKRLTDGTVLGNYVATKSTGPSYSELSKSGTVNWITVADLVSNWSAHAALETSGDDSLANDNAGTGNAIQTNLRQRYEYRMVQIPPSITVRQAIGNEAAFYLQRIVNEEASRGWEFMRVDTIGVHTPPGCLAGLFGGQVTTLSYYVVTFRRETALQASDEA